MTGFEIVGSLEQRLALFDPAQHGGEVMTTDEPLGAESGSAEGAAGTLEGD